MNAMEHHLHIVPEQAVEMASVQQPNNAMTVTTSIMMAVAKIALMRKTGNV